MRRGLLQVVERVLPELLRGHLGSARSRPARTRSGAAPAATGARTPAAASAWSRSPDAPKITAACGRSSLTIHQPPRTAARPRSTRRSRGPCTRAPDRRRDPRRARRSPGSNSLWWQGHTTVSSWSPSLPSASEHPLVRALVAERVQVVLDVRDRHAQAREVEGAELPRGPRPASRRRRYISSTRASSPNERPPAYGVVRRHAPSVALGSAARAGFAVPSSCTATPSTAGRRARGHDLGHGRPHALRQVTAPSTVRTASAGSSAPGIGRPIIIAT